MSSTKITSQIIDWVYKECPQSVANYGEVSADTHLIEQGIFDSMQILLFVGFLESEFDLTIGVEQMTPEFFATPAQIAAFVSAQLMSKT